MASEIERKFRRFVEDTGRELDGLRSQVADLSAKIVTFGEDSVSFVNYLRNDCLRLGFLIGEQDSVKLAVEAMDDPVKLRAYQFTLERKWDKVHPPRGKGEVSFNDQPKVPAAARKIFSRLGMTEEQMIAAMEDVENPQEGD
ncbi:MAG TPA: hypothetical protein VFI02_20595 [Armatimonadota bacterium]|nr:hypothetical protein [Armatimonadota bacterium]